LFSESLRKTNLSDDLIKPIFFFLPPVCIGMPHKKYSGRVLVIPALTGGH